MGRLLPLALIACAASVAHAEPTRSVLIETSPPGAMVYLELVENGPICEATPCTVELPVGEPNLVIELKGYSRLYHSLVVPRRGKIKRAVIALEKALGTIVVDGPRGATVLVDDEPAGKAPLRVDVSADAHHVVIMQGGKQLHDEFVEIKAGEEAEIRPGGGRAGDDDDDDEAGGDDVADRGDGGEDDDEDEDDVDLAVRRRPTPPPPARAPLVRAAAAIDLAFRQFSYTGIRTGDTIRPFNESGQVLAGVVVEAWPAARLASPVLRRLSLLARFQHGLNQQQITGGGLMDPATTFWQSLELSARYRHPFGKLGVEAGLGYVRDRAQFAGNVADILLLPDADYQAIRLGLRVTYQAGAYEPFASVEPRFVTSGGKLAERFADGTSISGLRASLGVARTFGRVSARVEAAFQRYAWDFAYNPMGLYRAETGTDAFQLIQIAVGYQY